ncbi:DNA primase [Methylomarinovum tepidoasis]|uniref:DNA primase n=1 Tax=Methylomarinovum tepidoasis TaxID=2840183 RepID=A0AAU9C8X4_9GAMM|nr:DNA primase [Methylomarinovum sp. IN45]BCX89734.1 DNA primase [Methylomarinovum sp. IN45]
MAGRIPQSFIDELLARVDIVDVINARVPLKKTGRNYVARCPFHDEKTPSFSVSPHKQFYYCFGCGASGSAIGFLMAYEHLSFPEAVETLAAQYGLTVPREGTDGEEDPSRRRQLEALLELNRQAARFYVQRLRAPGGRAVRDYLQRRGVDAEVAKRYGLGYAPDAWDSLSRRFDPRLLVEAGLAIERERGGIYDRFRHRLMFPIRNRRGQVIGFGGRALREGEGAKYLNSPETPVFHKGREVYGLHELLQANARPEWILLVEGYMDVVALAQHGIDTAVATLGTAVTSEHLRLLFRHSTSLVCCFDGDAAGRKAAWRALEAALPLLEEGRRLAFLWLPEGEDPDSLVRREGADAFRRRLAGAQPLSEYFFARLTEDLELSRLEDRAELSRRAGPLLKRLPPGAFRRMMQARLAELAGESRVESTVSARRRRAELPQPSLDERVAALLVHHPSLWPQLPQDFRQAAAGGHHGEWLAVLAAAFERGEEGLNALLEGAYRERFQVWREDTAYRQLPNPEGELQAAATALQQRFRRRRIEQLSCKTQLTHEEKAELRRLLSKESL